MSTGHNLGLKRFVAAASIFALGCGVSGPTPTDPSVPSVSSGTVVSLRSSETDQPVAGAVISLSGQSQAGVFSSVYTSNAAGQFALDRTVLLSSSPLLEVTAPGFVVRSTILRSDETTMSLWPASSPTGLDEAFSSTIAYSASACPTVNTGQSALRRVGSSVSVVQVSFGPSIQDPAAEAAHQQAIVRLNATLAGTPRYEFTGAPTGGVVSFVAEIDPNHSTCTAGSEPLRAATELIFANGNISGGRLVYCTIAAARSAGLVLHELGHTVGLYHSSSTTDVMYCSTGRPGEFSARERLVMKLIRQRRSGNRWPDNDRQVTAPLTLRARGTEVITCGGRVVP